MIVVALLILVIEIAIVVFLLASLWKIFAKAGEPGWSGIIPIYNMIILAKIAEKPLWWGALVLIPGAGIVFQIWLWNRTVKRFGKSEGFTVGVILLPFIFLPILGFGSASYTPLGDGPANEDTPTPPSTPEISSDETTSAE